MAGAREGRVARILRPVLRPGGEGVIEAASYTSVTSVRGRLVIATRTDLALAGVDTQEEAAQFSTAHRSADIQDGDRLVYEGRVFRVEGVTLDTRGRRLVAEISRQGDERVPDASDVARPQVTLTATPGALSAPIDIEVAWTDDVGVTATTAATSDVLVLDHRGDVHPATSIVTSSASGATYRVPAPAAGWAAGTFVARFQGGLVSDAAGNLNLAVNTEFAVTGAAIPMSTSPITATVSGAATAASLGDLISQAVSGGTTPITVTAVRAV